MWASSSTNSSYSSSVSSSDPHLPYQHPQPSSTVSLGSQPRRAPMKYRRFYSSPVDDGDSTPIQLYGLEQRPLSIIEKPKLFRRVSHALDDIKEDFAYQIGDPSSTAAKLKRRSTFLLDGSLGTAPRPETADCHGPPTSRRMSIMSAAPERGLSRRLSRRLSIFGGRKGLDRPSTASISTPNLIGSSAMN
ncbi:hypothetical protein N7504_004165 [Penicillium tannophilum]|nr:hypothetical protein N7504_004165 [Penicillium tannophilum]